MVKSGIIYFATPKDIRLTVSQGSTKLCDKKTGIFFFDFPLLSGKFGKQSLRFRGTKTFFFGITGFLVPMKTPSSYDDGGTIFFFPEWESRPPI